MGERRQIARYVRDLKESRRSLESNILDFRDLWVKLDKLTHLFCFMENEWHVRTLTQSGMHPRQNDNEDRADGAGVQ
jgi:hypothetical protein